MIELLPETAGKSSEIASVILSLSTAPRTVIVGLKFSKKNENLKSIVNSHLKAHSIWYIHWLCEVLKNNSGSTVSKDDIPEGKCESSRVFHAQFEKTIALLLL